MSSDLPQAGSMEEWKGQIPEEVSTADATSAASDPYIMSQSMKDMMAYSAGLSAVAGLVSSYAESEAIRDRARLVRRQLQRRIDLMKVQRRDVKRSGDLAVAQKSQQTRQLIGAQRVALAAQGISLNSQTAQQLQEESVNLGQLDVMTIRNNARRQMMGLDIQIGETRLEKALSRIQQGVQAGGTLVTGFTRASSSFATQAYNIYEG